MNEHEWKLPLNLAIGFHILLALSFVYLPRIFERTPRLEDIYTVDLINIAESLPAEAPPAAAEPAPAEPVAEPAPPVETPKPVIQEAPKKVVEEAIVLNEPKIVEPTPVTETAPVQEAVSLKPVKRKIKADLPPPPPETPKPQTKAQDISKLQRQKLAEVIKAEQKAAEEARILAEEAELERRLAESAARRAKLARARAAVTASSGQSGSTTNNSSRLTALELQYFSAVRARIQPFWTLPKFREWDPSLTALIVITIERDGRIAGSFLEATSGDSVFDRFALKVLDDVGHLPPIPAAINKDRIELGLKFTPGDIR